jgi:hypothetical protein
MLLHHPRCAVHCIGFICAGGGPPQPPSHKRSFSVMKVKDAILTRRKRQRDMGPYEAMKYFDKEVKIMKLTWSVIFDNVKLTDERRRLAMALG